MSNISYKILSILVGASAGSAFAFGGLSIVGYIMHVDVGLWPIYAIVSALVYVAVAVVMFREL